jgi:hypothetical protein
MTRSPSPSVSHSNLLTAFAPGLRMPGPDRPALVALARRSRGAERRALRDAAAAVAAGSASWRLRALAAELLELLGDDTP